MLVIANETVAGPELLAALKEHARGRKTKVLVVTPALNTKLKYWVSDEDGARAAAAGRLQSSLEAMRASGLTAEGEVGDPDPLQAIDDAIRTFSPDDIIISTHPEGRSNWLEQGIVEGARERFDVPVTHVVVDLDAAAVKEPSRGRLASLVLPAVDRERRVLHNAVRLRGADGDIGRPRRARPWLRGAGSGVMPGQPHGTGRLRRLRDCVSGIEIWPRTTSAIVEMWKPCSFTGPNARSRGSGRRSPASSPARGYGRSRTWR